ncbi:hypothetical protein ALC60_11625 [Trachymyrmex zeteki]|uniref:Uncharacterized protein n=1 Tax=Mycetomoellerius zeteki TaxID=64791 RepID=A0A151WNE1_9HYME|nr:hypothetical protein ALC60_11625 [Trachymyrmex zeteki]
MNRIDCNLGEFYYEGEANGEPCIFKINTGFNISIINENFIKYNGPERKIVNRNIKYPTGEQVLFKYEIALEDDCILGVNFLKLLNLQNIFDLIFRNPTETANDLKCSRMKDVATVNIPAALNTAALFKESCQYLSNSEKEDFGSFLSEFRDVFSNDIIAGNCKLGEHVINVKFSPY